jgi:hypothetical protein
MLQDQIHELYEYSLKVKPISLRILTGKVVSETNSEYIDIELNITGLLHNKVLDFRAVTSSAVKYLRANLSKEVEKT